MSAQVGANLHNSTPFFIEYANKHRLVSYSYLHNTSSTTALSDANADSVLKNLFASVAVFNLDSKYALQGLQLASSKHEFEVIRKQMRSSFKWIARKAPNTRTEHKTLEENNVVFDPPRC